MSRFDTHVDPPPDFTRYLSTVLTRVPTCAPHGATTEGQPCFIMPVDSQIGLDRWYNVGVCNDRAHKAGFVGDLDANPTAQAQFRKQEK